jgi:ubiquinone/menaquinone biosynthesis C-methylase UbiE
MSPFARSFCTGRLYQAFARRVLVPWGLQGVRLSGSALEIGCGSGAMAAQLLRMLPELSLVATDYDAEMVAVAAETLAAFGHRAQVRHADATQLPFADARFDAVLSFVMLHHVGDWKKAVAESIRVLRPGGMLIGYDLLDVLPFHGGHHGDGQMIRPGQLERAMAELPVRQVRVTRGLVGLVIRFHVTKAP